MGQACFYFKISQENIIEAAKSNSYPIASVVEGNIALRFSLKSLACSGLKGPNDSDLDITGKIFPPAEFVHKGCRHAHK